MNFLKRILGVATQPKSPAAYIFPAIFSFSSLTLLYISLTPASIIGWGITPLALAIGYCILLACVYWLFPKHEWFIHIFRTYKVPAAIFVAMAMRVAELLIYPNYVYSHIHIDPNRFSLLSAVFAVTFFTTLDKRYIKKHLSWIIFILGLTAFHILFLRWYDYHVFDVWSDEDGLFENGHFISYAVGGVCFAIASWYYLKSFSQSMFSRIWAFITRKKTQTFLSHLLFVYLLCGTIGYTVLAGEEISWGQRIFHFETPEQISKKNTQYEFNFHNNHFLFPHVYQIYGLISLYALLSPLLFAASRRWPETPRKLVALATFRWHHIPYFIPMLIYVAYRLYYNTTFFDIWEEATELTFGMGMAWFAFQTLTLIRSEKRYIA